jgi:hypothetical protein
MFTKIVLGIVAMWIVGGCGIASRIIMETMITDLNAQLPRERQFARQGWRPTQHFEFYSQYWRTGLSRRPLLWLHVLGGVMLVAFVVLWWVVWTF